MAIESLKDLYIDQLRNMHSANTQALELTRQFVSIASNDELRSALEAGAAGIERGIEAVSTIVRAHGAEPEGAHSEGMDGMLEEAEAEALEEVFEDDDVRDAMIIAQYQKMTHYGIAGYGTVLALARRLQLEDDARRLEECLGGTRGGDRHMTELAEREVNRDAAE